MESGIWIQGLGSLLASLFLASHNVQSISHLTVAKVVAEKSISIECGEKDVEISLYSDEFGSGRKEGSIDEMKVEIKNDMDLEVEVEVEDASSKLKKDKEENENRTVNAGGNEDLEGLQLLSEATSNILKWTSNSPNTPNNIVTSSIRNDVTSSIKNDVLQVVQDSIFEIFKFCEQAQKEDDEDFGISYTEKDVKTEKCLLSFCDNSGREFLLQIIGESVFVGYSTDVIFLGGTYRTTLQSSDKVSLQSSNSQNGEKNPYFLNQADSTNLKSVRGKNVREITASDFDNNNGRRKQEVTNVYITLLSAVKSISEKHIAKKSGSGRGSDAVSGCADSSANIINSNDVIDDENDVISKINNEYNIVNNINNEKIILNNLNDPNNNNNDNRNETTNLKSETENYFNQNFSALDSSSMSNKNVNVLYNTESISDINLNMKNIPFSTEQNIPKKVPKKRMFRVVIVAADDDEEPSPVVPKKKKKKTAIRYVILFI